MTGGWGCYSHSPSSGEIILHEEILDEDGGFRGHTWVEDDDGLVVDLMHDIDGGASEIYVGLTRVAIWHRRPKLERLVKGFWRADMRAAIKAGRQLMQEAQ